MRTLPSTNSFGFRVRNVRMTLSVPTSVVTRVNIARKLVSKFAFKYSRRFLLYI